MMRVLLWYWGRRGGGVHYALSLARALAQDELVLSLSRQNSLIEDFRTLDVPRQEVNTYTGGISFLASLTRLPYHTAQLLKFAREQRVDCVLSAMPHTWTPIIAPMLASRGFPYVPVIHDAAKHPGDPDWFFDWRLKRELDSARAAIVLSEAVGRCIAQLRPGLALINSQLGAHLPFHSVSTMPQWDFLFFGRIVNYKGLDLLRDAWRSLWSVCPGATLRVLGNGNVEHCAHGLIGMPGVTVEQRWVPDSDLGPEIASARILVVPYREASQSGVVPIALALGLPVIATSVGGLPEQVKDGESGLVVPAEADALASAMRRMLCPKLFGQLTEGAKEQSASLLDWGTTARLLRADLHQLLQNGRNVPDKFGITREISGRGHLQ